MSGVKVRVILNETLTIHPAFRLDLRKPILRCWNSPQVFPYMLFPDVANWNLGSFMVADGDAKDAFGEENPFGVMAQGAVAEVWEESFRFVKPTVDREVVLEFAAEFLGAVPCMFNGVCHS
jgi:hypothetical protein